jgi:hypothetical protein
VRSYRLHTFGLRSALWKPRPPEGAADARLKRNFDRVPAKIKCPVETFRPQERLRVSKTCASDCLQVPCWNPVALTAAAGI